MQTSLQTTANATGKFWTHVEIKHAQGPDFTSLYPANTGGGGSWVKGKRSEVRGYGLAMGRGKNLFWGSCSSSFGGNVLLK